uniref:FHF complex subunit HOOK interacting protein 2A isoform X2 n=1 Tax=Myxine glutinosa TaxID=7769 RepID=UPI00358EE328
MLGKITSMLQHAVEALAPTLPLQEDFIHHWKCITNYYIETADDKAPVTETNIPLHLDQMLEILVEEEEERESGEMGPCMEYLLQHKILETMYTLSTADCPPGMKQQVLMFFTKLLGRIQQPILPHINVYRPVQKLVRLCGLVQAAPTENEEMQFLCTVCAKVKQDPYLVNFFLENKDSHKDSALDNSLSPCALGGEMKRNTEVPYAGTMANATVEHDQGGTASSVRHANDLTYQEYSSNGLYFGVRATCRRECNLVHSLLTLISSPDGRIAVKACEGLMLLVSLPDATAAQNLAGNTALCEMLTQRLTTLHHALPTSLDPLDIESLQPVNWGLDGYNQKEDTAAFPGKRTLISFLSWLDYCDQLIKEAHEVTASALAVAIRQRFFVQILEPRLLQMSEEGILVSTALLARIVRQVESQSLLGQLVVFLLGERRPQPEEPGEPLQPILRQRLIERCDHISDEVSIMTMKTFETLLQKPHPDILWNLVLQNLQERNYMEYKPPTQEDAEIAENGQIAGAVDLEEDPLFGDVLSGNQFLSSDWLYPSPQLSPEHGKDGKTEVHKVVNSFLCIVPDEAKSSYQVEGTGYDTYLRDAHKQFRDCCTACTTWDWPAKPTPVERCNLEAPFFEGHLFKVLFDRMSRILDQPYDVNLQITSVLSKLALFPHPHLHEFVLDPYVNLASGCRSLFSVIVRVVGDLMVRIQRIPEFNSRLLMVRRRLVGLDPDTSLIDHLTLLEGVIVLEEFCKELAAVAFVKHHAESTL